MQATSRCCRIYGRLIWISNVPISGQPNSLFALYCVASNCPRTWGARYINSSQIFTYGAGFYNFFNNWDSPSCLGTESCQEGITDFENSTEVYIWGMVTKGSSYMIRWNGTDLVPQAVNKAAYVEAILLFEMTSTQ